MQGDRKGEGMGGKGVREELGMGGGDGRRKKKVSGRV